MKREQSWTQADVDAYMLRQGFASPFQPVGSRPSVPPPQADMPEGTLLERIRGLAKAYGWEAYHTHDSRRSEPGFPDLVLCDGRDLLIYELKTNTGKPTPEQARWLSLLAHTGTVESGVWRPRDLTTITNRLSRRSPAC